MTIVARIGLALEEAYENGHRPKCVVLPPADYQTLLGEVRSQRRWFSVDALGGLPPPEPDPGLPVRLYVMGVLCVPKRPTSECAKCGAPEEPGTCSFCGTPTRFIEVLTGP